MAGPFRSPTSVCARWAWQRVDQRGDFDFIEYAKLSGALRDFFIGVLKSQVDALLRLQAPSGAWHTLLDDATYEETSATAGFAYALLKGARLGIGDKAWQNAGCGRSNLCVSKLMKMAPCKKSPTARVWGTIYSFTKTFQFNRLATGKPWRSFAWLKLMHKIFSEAAMFRTIPQANGQAITYWLLSDITEVFYDTPNRPMQGEMDPFFF